MKKISSGFLSIMLCIVFVFILMSETTYAINVPPYGMTSTSIGVGSGSTLASATTKVSFGGRRWYVVGFNGTGINKGDGYITLLSETAAGSSIFSDKSDGTWNDYSGSSLQTAVNSLLSPMDSREQAVMVGLTLDGVDGPQPANQKVWAPSYSDVSAISQDVRKLDNPWWIRSICGYGNPIYISSDGTINSQYGLSNTMSEAVRPGTAINLSNVLYAAPITGAKDTAVGTMNIINQSSAIKFTILDTSLGLTIAGAPASLSKSPGDIISLNFSGASTGTGKYVSCVLVSQNDNLLKYYAKLTPNASGTLSIPISAGVQSGSYTLLIYNEQINSGDISDYASTPVSINLTVSGSTNIAPTLKAGVSSTAAASVSVNSAYTLDLSTIFYDPDNVNLSYRVYVNGSNSAISADKNYSFTPSAAGTTTLRFTAYDGAAESPSYTVTLTATNVLITNITVTTENNATKIGVNSQLQLYYTVQPSNATNKSVTWTVTFSGAGSWPDGDVDAANMLRTSAVTSNGTVTIRATANDGSGVYAQINLNILSNIVTGISVSAASEDLTVNESTQMTAAVSPSNASRSVTWSISSGSGIASVSSSGLLSLTGSGSVTVRATAADGSGIYGEKTLTIKNIQRAPAAPTLMSKTATSITLNSVTGAEYSINNTVWQSSTTFNNLTPNTSYSLCARMARTETLQVSPASAALAVTTDKSILSGSVIITGIFRYHETLTANTSALTAEPVCSLGTLSYRWTRDGTDIAGANLNTYSLGADDLGKVINVTVTSDNCTGSKSSGNIVATAKSDPDYVIPAGLTAVYGNMLSDVALPSGFTWEAANPSVTPVGGPGNNSFYVTYTPADTNCYNIITEIAVTVTVNKATPSITTSPVASAITYGQALSSSVLTGGTGSIAGSFAWTDGTMKPSVSDSNTTNYSITFTPDDTGNYNTVQANIKLTVNKAVSSVTVPPAASAIIYGQALSTSVLSGGTGSVGGSFAWTNGAVKPSVSDSNTTEYSITFTPNDTGNYNTAAVNIKLTVNKATPIITATPAASAITYGQALSASVLSGGTAGVSGSFTWTNGVAKPSVSDSNTTSYSVTFTPVDAVNYNTAATTVKLTVNGAASSVINIPAASAITYGQTLSASVLSGGTGSVAGSFAWKNGTIAPSVSDSNTTDYSVTFTPVDSNYAISETKVKLTVNKAVPVITAPPAASAITYGQALSASVLSGGSGSVAGSFTWTNGVVKPSVSDSNTTEYSVTFTPVNGNYASASANIKLTVNKATPSVTAAPAASAITYGQTLADSFLSGGTGSVAGSFTWTNGTIKPSVSDSNTTEYSITFTPDDTGNYNTVQAYIKLTVNKAASSVNAPPTASAITYKQALSASVLSGGTGSVEGSFAWTDGTLKPSVSDSNSTEYSVTFTPVSGNYASSSANIKLTVNKAVPSVTAVPAASAITYGQTLADSVLSGGTGNVAGSFAWTDGTMKPSVSDSNTTNYSIIFTPDDTGNYNTAVAKIRLTVNKAASSVTAPPAASAITYEQALSASVLSGGAGSVAGTFSWTNGIVKPSVSDSNTTEYSVTFTPADANYALSETKVKLTVNKAASSISSPPAASAITYGQSLSASVLSGGSGTVAGSFTWTNGVVKPSVSDSNTTEYSVTFTPISGNYDSSSANIKLTVNKATPTITAAPSASAITYGQTLSASVLSGGTGSVAGSFAWTNGAVSPSVSDSNTTEYSITFTPNDTGNYNTFQANIKLTVNKAASSVSAPPAASAITYRQTLSASVLSGGTASVDGSFAWTDGNIMPSVSNSNTTEYLVTFTPVSGNYASSSANIKLTVNKATPSITAVPAASAIIYGQVLSDSVLSGGTGSVGGSFAWTNGNIKPSVSDSNTTEYSITFTPDDTGNYNVAQTNIKLTVNKAATSVTVPPTASAVIYRQALSASVLSGGTGSIDGSFAWTDSTIEPSVSDSNTTEYSVTFTPSDSNYAVSEIKVTLTVNKAASSVTAPPAASAIIYGQALLASVFTGGTGSVEGIFTWTDETVKPAVSDSNTTNYLVTFTPVSENYASSSTNIKLTVNKAAPTITAVPAASAITYGQALSDSVLSDGTGSVDGSFAWTDGTIMPAVSDSDTTEYSITFTPDDTSNYNTAAANIKLTVNKASSSVTVPPTASAITYEQALSVAVLSGGTGSVEGSFAWTDGTEKPSVSDSNTTEYSVTFTPVSGNYASSSAKIKLAVNKASTSIATVPAASAITYAQSLSDSVLSGGTASVDGSFAWTDGSMKPSISDSNTTKYSITFTPDDTGNYKTATANITLTVNKAAPSITAAPAASAINYEQALSDSVLSGGTASVDGSFAWTDGTIKPSVSDSNTTEYSLTFTPVDTDNYNTVQVNIKLTVNKAATFVTSPPVVSAITYGQTLSASVLSGGTGSVEGSFAWTNGTLKPSVSDSNATDYSVTFAPADGNYASSSINIKLTVNKATPIITAAPTALAITYGQALSDSVLSVGTGSVDGSFAWTDGTIKPSVSDSNTTEYSITFTPDDTGNYNTASTNINLTVNKATPSITAAPAASAITYEQALSDSVLSGGTASVDGSFAWTDGTVKPSVSDSNTTEYSVTFTPVDTGNYNTVQVNIKLTVNKAASYVTAHPVASAITYEQALSTSVLSGGTGSVDGSFTWTDGTIKPSVSDSKTTDYSITFTPVSGNYAPSSANIKLTVSKASSSIIAAPVASAITYEQALSDSVLSGGTASVDGSFTWTDGTVKPSVSDSNTTEYSVTFTPVDTGNYNTVQVNIKLTVNKAASYVTAPPAASAITYEQALSASVLSGGTSNVDGSFTWTVGTIKPSVSDSNTTEYSVTFTPVDTGNYNTAVANIRLTINKAVVFVITPPAASPITSGQKLSDSVLSGGRGSVEGSFTWTDGTIKSYASDSNKTEYSVTFTPKDTNNYNTAITMIKIKVNQIPLFILPSVIATKYNAPVIVRGITKLVGNTATVTNSDGTTSTTVTVNTDMMINMLSSEDNGVKITVPIIDDSDSAAVILTGNMVKILENKKIIIEIQTGHASYILPASEINIDEILKQFGADVTLEDITVRIEIAASSDETVKMIEKKALAGKFTILIPPVDYIISCTNNGKTIRIENFSGYVEKLILIPAEVSPKKISTGIIIKKDGSVYQVPTQVVLINGIYYAKISSLTNSTYTVVWNPVKFSDVKNHWARDVINDMGSRMIMSGNEKKFFDPDRSITRAEFAAVIVKALGLAPGIYEKSFDDVLITDWYCGYIKTATEYGIIKGYGKRTFGPDNKISNEQAITMIFRAMKITGLKVNLSKSEINEIIKSLKDRSVISSYTKESIAACLHIGIITDKDNIIIAPKEDITRAEVAVLVQKLLQKSGLI